MCIRDRAYTGSKALPTSDGIWISRAASFPSSQRAAWLPYCLLYTSDAADDLLCVDLGGRRIIKKKIIKTNVTELEYMFNIVYNTNEPSYYSPNNIKIYQ